MVALEDSEHFAISDADIKQCLDFISKRNRTIVVCTAGISRSATICIVALMQMEGDSLQEAMAKVKAARRFIKPNPGFMRFLHEYEVRLKQTRAKL